IDVRDEAVAITAPIVVTRHHVGFEHLGDATALAHEVLNALAHLDEHRELCLQMSARLYRPHGWHDERVGIRDLHELASGIDEAADPTARRMVEHRELARCDCAARDE